MAEPTPFKAASRDLLGLILRHQNHEIALNQPYQRSSSWGDSTRINYIRSLINGYPLGAITVNERPHQRHTWVVIDGKQRIETLVAWFGNALEVPAEWFPSSALPMHPPARVRFCHLEGAARRAMENATISVFVGSQTSLAAEAEIFLRLNKSQNSPADLAAARAIVRSSNPSNPWA